jgi:glycosyltransferase involved in cell wall biosynthesis
MKKICLVIHSLGIGGMERVMALLANHFADVKNAEVHLVLIGIRRNIDYPVSEKVRVLRPPFSFRNSRRTIDTLRTMKFLRSEVNQINPDTVLSFGEYWNNLVLLSLYGLKYPVYISDRSQPDKDLGRVQNRLRDFLYPKAAGFIAQTSKAREICLKNGWNRNVKVIGNPIRRVGAGDEEKKEKIVLSVGRLIKTKHFDDLIRMFVELNVPGWKLVIVGGDAKRQKLSEDLKSLIREHNAEQKVFLAGEQKDIDSYYHRAKLFAFSSSSEGYPNVVGEALSAGLPVIAYDCIAGPSDMIEVGKNGYLIPLFKREVFKEKLQELMINEEKREMLGDNAIAIRKENDERDIAEQFYAFITGEPVIEESIHTAVQ